MLVTHNDLSLNYKIVAPIAIEYNSSQYRPDEALDELESKANSIGADAIIGFRWSPIPIVSRNASVNMMTQGTAVILLSIKNKTKDKNINNKGGSKHEN